MMVDDFTGGVLGGEHRADTRDGPAHSHTGHTEQTQPLSLTCSLLSTETCRGFERKAFRSSLQSKFNITLLRKGSVLKDVESVHHAVPSTYLCHSELPGNWNDPRSSAGETPLLLAWHHQSQESRWRDPQRRGCNAERHIRATVGDSGTALLLQSTPLQLTCASKKQTSHGQ